MSSSPSLHTAPRVLRGGDAQLLQRARVTTPRSEIVLPVLEEAPLPDEPVLVDPVAEAFRAGLQAGRAAAEDESLRAAAQGRETALSAAVEALSAAATKIATSREALMDQVLGEISELVVALVRELVAEELALRDEPARAAIERALRFAPPDVDLVVALNPNDEIAAWELESLVPGRRIRVLEDDAVELGGCILEVGSARIDAQIGPALERLRDALAHLQVDPDLEETG